MQEHVIESILKLCSKNNFNLIEDYEWLLFEILTKLTLRIQSVENATLFSKIIIVIFLFFKNCVSGM